MSMSEGSGKLLNYMAMALPIVAYDTSVNREYLDDLGVYAEPGDVGAFAGAIASLLHAPERRCELGRQLRQRVIERFSWQAAADHILKVYKSLDKR
jgi:glycosyltransferase involved in cell wall biosynthesis